MKTILPGAVLLSAFLAQTTATASSPAAADLWNLARQQSGVHRFSTLFTAQDVRGRLANESGLAAALDWCKRTAVTQVYESDPEVLRFTVDGAVVREERNTHWHQPLALCFDSETFAGWFGLPKDDALPATFSIDYIRTWKRKDGPADNRPEAVEFSFPGRTGAVETVCRLKVEEGGALVVKAKGGAERPERVHVDYVDDGYFASQEEPEIQRKLTVRSGEGQGLSFLITWSKSEPWKREGRERAGEAPGSPNPPTNGYHAVGVDVRPLAAKPRGTVEVWELPTEGGAPLRVTGRH